MFTGYGASELVAIKRDVNTELIFTSLFVLFLSIHLYLLLRWYRQVNFFTTVADMSILFCELKGRRLLDRQGAY